MHYRRNFRDMVLDAVYSIPVSTEDQPVKGILPTLAVACCMTFLVWFLDYHWRRRKLYIYSWNVPGPFAWPLIGSALTLAGDTTKIFNTVVQLFEVYKPLARVWLGNRLFYGISTPEHLEIVLNSPHCLRKEELYKYAGEVVGTGLFTASVAKWKKHRKIIMPTFNQKILDQFVEIFVEQSLILRNNLKKHAGTGEVDIFSIISAYTLDTICESAMGVKINAQTSNQGYADWVDTAMRVVFQRMFTIWYHFDFIFNLFEDSKNLYEARDNIHQFTKKVVVEKRIAYEQKMNELKHINEVSCDDEPIKRKAFLDLLIELSYNGAKFTDEELREEVDTITIAGSDTSASTICFALTMLAMHPEVQQAVYQETLDILGSDREITYQDLPNFKYLERVIKETLRLFPVGPFLVRGVDADVDLKDGYILPQGSSAFLAIICVHRNPDIWKNPLEFNPDRFLPTEIVKRHPYSYLGFSGGPRNCIGPRYAMMTMKTVIASLIRQFRFKTSYRSVEDIKLKTNLVLRPVNGFKVSVELRK